MRPIVENRSADFHMSMYRSMDFPDHLHTQTEILLPRTGAIHAMVDSQTWVAEPGEALWVFPNRLHGYSRNESSEGMILIFSPSVLPDMGVNWGAVRPVCPVIKMLHPDAQYAAERLWACRGTSQPDRSLRALLYLLTAGLLEDMETEKVEKPMVDDILYHTLSYLSDHCIETLTLKKTARAVGVNEYYLSHLLGSNLHMGFRQYVNLLRMEKACRLLSGQFLTIEEIGFQCGFSNLRSFDRVFLQMNGCTPREYRIGQQNGEENK